MKRLRAATLLLAVAVSACACESPPPEWVWVPAADFEATLEVWLGHEPGRPLRANAWIPLHASRSTGPWIRAKYEDLPADASWLTRPPEAREDHVEANVQWQVEPGGHHRFNLSTAQDILSRRVLFDAPGRYKIWAESHTWGGGPVASNVVEIVIEP